jgi:hypothetical protein
VCQIWAVGNGVGVRCRWYKPAENTIDSKWRLEPPPGDNTPAIIPVISAILMKWATPVTITDEFLLEQSEITAVRDQLEA